MNSISQNVVLALLAYLSLGHLAATAARLPLCAHLLRVRDGGSGTLRRCSRFGEGDLAGSTLSSLYPGRS